MCPSCYSCRETTAHILFCRERNRQDLFRRSADNLLVWLKESKTAPYLRDCIMEYVRGQGDLQFQGICEAKGRFLRPLGVSQDKIGWRRFMEGMVSKEFEQQHEATYLSGGTIKTIWEGLGTKTVGVYSWDLDLP